MCISLRRAYDAVNCYYLIYDTQLHYNLLLSRSLWFLLALFIPSYSSECWAGCQEHNSVGIAKAYDSTLKLKNYDAL